MGVRPWLSKEDFMKKYAKSEKKFGLMKKYIRIF